MNKVLSFLFICAQVTIFGAEVDSFTDRFVSLEDSLVAINEQTNIYFKEALELANSKARGCKEKTLYKSLRKYFGNQYRSKFGIQLLQKHIEEEFEVSTVYIDSNNPA